jgi:UDP-glucuronate decarboxylase
MKTILVTGGAGFIGSNLCKQLLDDGNQVTCLDNFYSSDSSNINEFFDNPNFIFINHNVIEPLTIKNNFDEIYHLACPASPKQYQKDPIFTLDTNYLGSKNILEFAMSRNSKVLLTSTSEVYGDPLVHPQPETYWGNVNPIGIRSCYDEGKRISETLFTDYHRKYDLPICIARIFNTYGPRMNNDDGRVVSNFINQALYDNPLTVYGNGSQTRSFCYIDDMVGGLIDLMSFEGAYSSPINLGSNLEVSVREIAELIVSLCNSKSMIKYFPLPEDDPKLRRPELTKAIEELSWTPKTKIEDGLQLTINYFKEKHNV